MLNRFVVIDLETTGNAPKRGDKIIQFAAVVIENEKIIETFSSLINPCQPIPAFIEELTGINDDMVKDSPVFSEIAAKVVSLLENAYFVAHNVLFDLSFLQEELLLAGYEGFYGPIIDTVEMARILFPTADGYKLSDLALQENLNHERPHQADSDALVTAELLLLFIERASKLPLQTLRQLTTLSGGLKSDLHQLFEELLYLKERKIEELPVAVEMIKGLAIKKFETDDKNNIHDMKFEYPNNNQAKMQMMQKAFDQYETRAEQFVMMDDVFQSFLTETHLIIEAGTGVGKSIAYLLPAAYFSNQTRVPVMVSTHTIQLQEQLIRKEISLLSKLTPFPVKAVLLKGKDHYLSLEKFRQSLSDENDNYDTTLTKMQILVWLLETTTGDKDELNLSSGGHIFWNKVKNENSYGKQMSDWGNKDFYIRAKENAEQANIVITNHSLLLSDLTAKKSILPEYHYAVIDEGHHFERAAAQFFGKTLDYLHVRLLVSQLGLFEQKQFFYELENLLKSHPEIEGIIHTFELNQLVSELLFEMDEFFKLTMFFAQKMAIKRSPQRLKVRITNQSKELTAMIYSAERFSFLLKDVEHHFRKRLNLVQSTFNSLSAIQKGFIKEFYSLLEDLAELRETIKEIMLMESKFVKWIEIDLRAPQNVTTISMQPASVADYLDRDFFRKKKSIVVTSATLTVNQSFSFVRNELGLADYFVKERILPSPFNYKQQVQLLIPEDLPEINSVSMDDYVVAITEHIITIAEATKGRMLLLFTSHEMLKKTYELIKESGFLSDFAIIAQGITSGSRTRLTRNFQRYEKAILLGTSSFWEGVDIPGEDLSCLVIVRLPFSPPDDPFTEAKCEFVKSRGGNAFTDYSLPEAILRFKQGFGRLIRTENDRGVIVVLDKRIISTGYGKEFFKSIPQVAVKNGPIDELIPLILDWLW